MPEQPQPEQYSLIKHKENAHEDAIWSVCWAAPDKLLTGSLDNTAKFWNFSVQENEPTKLEELFVIDGHALGVVSVDVSPVGSIVATSAMDCKIRMFDHSKDADEIEYKTISAGNLEAWTIRFSPDGKFIATGNIAGKIKLFSTELGDETEPSIVFDAGKFVYSFDFVSNQLI